MTTILNYTPGQTATFYQEVLDGYGVRTDDGYIPVITRVILPGFTLSDAYPQSMMRFDVGLYYFQLTIPSGAASLGTWFVDIAYLNPVSLLVVSASWQIVVLAPFGNFGITVGGA
jgi:hypothetical protein